MNKPTCASLFSGGGLWELGAKAAGFNPVWAVELEPAIAEVFHANHPDTPITVASVQDVNPARLEAVDLLHASPPCQAHSQARSKSLDKRDDEEVGLIVLDYLKALRPRLFTLENVPPYQHHPVFKRIVAGLFQLGYFVHFDVLNAADYGIPQTRRRLILRTVRGGLVPMLPEPTPWQGWYSAIEDLIPTLPESAFAPWQLARLPELIDTTLIDRLNSGNNNGAGTHRRHVDPAFTITASYDSKHQPPQAFIVHPTADNDRFMARQAEEPIWSVLASNNMPRAFLVDCQYNGAADENGNRGLTIRQAPQPSHTIAASANRRTIRAWLDCGRVVSMTTRALARFQSVSDSYQLPTNNALACKVIGNGVPPEMARRFLAGMAEVAA